MEEGKKKRRKEKGKEEGAGLWLWVLEGVACRPLFLLHLGLRSRGQDSCWCSTCFIPFLYLLHGVILIWKHTHKHPQNCVFQVILDRAKLTLMIKHYICNFQAVVVKENSMLLTYIIFQYFYSLYLWLFKLLRLCWGDGSEVKITSCSCRAFTFHSQHSRGLSKQSTPSGLLEQWKMGQDSLTVDLQHSNLLYHWGFVQLVEVQPLLGTLIQKICFPGLSDIIFWSTLYPVLDTQRRVNTFVIFLIISLWYWANS